MKYILPTLLAFILVSCASDDTSVIDDEYVEDYQAWQSKLAEGRKHYLKLAGLFRLRAPLTTFGVAADNDYRISTEGAPETIGTYAQDSVGIEFRASEGTEVVDEDGNAVEVMTVELDARGNSKMLYCGNVSWLIITRGDKPYIRIWDAENPAVGAFTGYEWYPTDPSFIFDAQFEYYDAPQEQDVKSRLGVTESTNMIGKVTFEYNGETHDLDVGTNGFTMVHDGTSGIDSYGGGRYIYLDVPEGNGNVFVDLNRLYNPPCAFSEYTTCLLPPVQNRLPFEVTAGEKYAE